MTARIAILNLHRNNLASLVRAMRRLDLGLEVRCIESVSEARLGDGLVLPGVGSFGSVMSALDASEERERLIAAIYEVRFVIGICLGMQLLASTSTEGGHTRGLGVIPGRVARFPERGQAKVPNIGWRRSVQCASSEVSLDLNNRFFYHVHSYYMLPEDPSHVYATSRHGDIEYATVIGKGNTIGMQFHPEISSNDGHVILGRAVGHLIEVTR